MRSSFNRMKPQVEVPDGLKYIRKPEHARTKVWRTHKSLNINARKSVERTKVWTWSHERTKIWWKSFRLGRSFSVWDGLDIPVSSFRPALQPPWTLITSFFKQTKVLSEITIDVQLLFCPMQKKSHYNSCQKKNSNFILWNRITSNLLHQLLMMTHGNSLPYLSVCRD